MRKGFQAEPRAPDSQRPGTGRGTIRSESSEKLCYLGKKGPEEVVTK